MAGGIDAREASRAAVFVEHTAVTAALADEAHAVDASLSDRALFAGDTLPVALIVHAGGAATTLKVEHAHGGHIDAPRRDAPLAVRAISVV
jgi:hypothetical protein